MAGRRRLCAGAVGLALAMGPVVASTGASARAALQPIDLTVMTFNIWYGATVTHGLDGVPGRPRGGRRRRAQSHARAARDRRRSVPRLAADAPRLEFPILNPRLEQRLGLPAARAGRGGGDREHAPHVLPYTPYRIVNRGLAAPATAQNDDALDQIRDHLSALQFFRQGCQRSS
jgi:hypothetical protein